MGACPRCQHDHPPDTPRGPDPRHGYSAAINEIAHAHADLIRLTAEVQSGESYTFWRLAKDLGQRHITIEDLARVYVEIADVASSGWTKRWDEYLPGTCGPIRRVIREKQLGITHTPNAPCGAWRGPWPLKLTDSRPRRDQPVVYILYDSTGPCYYGSAGSLLRRLDQHHRSGREFNRWCAYPCASRELAYRIEDRLLKRRKPPGNLRAGR